jgi:hypothetical protein
MLDIKAIMNLNNLTKVGYLFDSSVSKWHDPQFNPDILKTGMRNHTSDSLFYFEFLLAHILVFGIGESPYIAQFDQDSAW